ncbi:MAG: cytochrome ubiquinol oxidase subunit I [Chloroflexi bacterium]|nr:cytochrome ubiquinol oxidase subunit I [Chloroflexota bacterium]
MDPVILARLQFAIVTIYHFFFVPLTLGLSIIVALMETIYVRTGREVFKTMTKFWGKLFVINFAMGVVTGIVQEFQFGMNWADFSRFVGDIFGAPLAIEALLAFFLESVFLGVWIFGWNRLSKGLHATTIWLVAIGSNVSAFWILIANAFMQQPVGYAIENGRAVMTNFAALVFNPKVWEMFPHTISAGLVTAAFFVMGISAYHLLRKQYTEVFNHSFRIAAILGSIAIVLVALNGHSQTQQMVSTQPMKLASAEALWETEDPASLSILTIGDLSLRNEIFSIRIPNLLSLLSFNQIYGEVKGINDLQVEYEQLYGPGDYVPPVAIVYWSFRVMIGIGVVLLLLGLYGLFLVMGDTIEVQSTSMKVFIIAILLPYLANSAGWVLTEVGRIPWIVFGLMKVQDGISPTVPGGLVLTSLIVFTLVYAALMVADVYLLTKYAKAGPSLPSGEDLIPTPEGEISFVGTQN